VFRDGKTLATAGADQTMRLWDIDTSEERFVFDGGTCIFGFLKLSPDGRTLAAGGRDGTIRLYRAASPTEVKAEPGWWRVAEYETPLVRGQ
jgi:WD40 repeat protein